MTEPPLSTEPPSNHSSNPPGSSSTSNHTTNNHNHIHSTASLLLLSLVKDERYIQTGQEFLSQIVPHFTTTTHSWLISALFYIWCTMRRHNGKSLGMQATGLALKNPTLLTKTASSALLATLIAYIGYYYHNSFQPQPSPTNNQLTRRQVFEQQRREMMQRAVRLEQQQESTSQQTTTTATTATTSRIRRLHQLRQAIQQALESIVAALQSCASGASPHDLSHTVHPWTVGVWCLRLRTAYLCLGGGQSWFATLHSTSSKPSRQERLLGILILSHAVGHVGKELSRLFLSWLVQRRQQQQYTKLEQSPPEELKSSRLSDSSTVVVCAICQEPRQHPSCSVRCGHVCCWTCWQTWAATHLQCPVCRTACRPQDISPLDQYQ